MEDDLDTIRNYFNANLTKVGVDQKQLIMDNAPDKSIDEKKVWTRFKIMPGAGQSQGIAGGFRYVRVGLITFDVYAPKGEGAKSAYALASKVEKLFANWRKQHATGYVKCFLGTYRQPADDKNYRVTLTVPWESVRREEYPGA